MKSKTVLVTGATGQVVSELALLLHAMGWRVLCLVRHGVGKSAQERLDEALPTACGMVKAIPGNIVEPLCGVSSDTIGLWNGQIDAIVHGAAAISFDAKDADEVRLTNTGGTKNALALATALGIPDFHYISTAYVAGDREVFHEDDLDVGQRSFNAYEESKIAAEKLVHQWKDGRFAIYRLPTVLGRSDDGKVLTYHSYYGFFMAFWRLLCFWRKVWLSNPEKCRAAGIVFDEKGVMHLPVFINCTDTAVLNMVCVDWVANMMAALLQKSCTGLTYHLVNQNPTTVIDVINQSFAIMGIAGVRFGVADMSGFTPELVEIQVGLNKKIDEIYGEYIRSRCKLTDDNIARELGDEYVPHPYVGEPEFKTMLGYAIADNFGRKKK